MQTGKNRTKLIKEKDLNTTIKTLQILRYELYRIEEEVYLGDEKLDDETLNYVLHTEFELGHVLNFLKNQVDLDDD